MAEAAADARPTVAVGEPLFEVENLVKHYPVRRGAFLGRGGGVVRAVDGVSFTLRRGETLGIVGESGCGKSTLARVLLRLVEPTSGRAVLAGENLFELEAREMRVRRRQTPDHLPGPLRIAQPAHDSGRDRPRAVGDLSRRGASRRMARSDRGPADPGRAERGRCPPLPPSVLGGPAPAHRDRPVPRPQPRGRHLRRAGLRPRRLHPGPGHQPPRGDPGRVRPLVHLHRPRPLGRAPHLGPGRGHVPREVRGDRHPGRRSTSGRPTPTPRRSSRRYRRSTRPSAPAASSSRARCRARSIHRPAAVSAPVAARRKRAARPRSRPSSSAPAAIRSACHFAAPATI